MTERKIKSFILTGEGYHIEFKKGLDKSLIDVVCAFANSSGGYVLLGVSDNGAITGIDTSNRTRSHIQDMLNKLQPKLDITIEVKKNIIVIDIPEGQEKPYGSSRGFFMRVGASSQKMTRNEIIGIFQKEGRIHFEELVNEKAKFKKDFDSKAFKHFLQLSGISFTLQTETILQNLDCLTSDKELTNLGVLFFAKDIDFIMHYALVDCILFKGTKKVKILDRKQYKGNIIANIESALTFVQRHTNVEYIITGKPRREEVSDYPESALREAIVNAVCHRDYFEKRCHVMVEIFADRVEIYNPGGLPRGLNPKQFGTKSVPRNLRITSMLHRANYVEQAGTGINRIRQAIAKHKKKIKLDIQYSNKSLFYNVVFRKTEMGQGTTQEVIRGTTQEMDHKTAQKADYSIARGVDDDTHREAGGATTLKTGRSIIQKVRQKTTQEMTNGTTQEILDLICKNRFITREELSKAIGSITPDGVKYHLKQLKKHGVLKRIGSTKGGYWVVVKK